MPTFKVRVVSKTPVETADALNRAGIRPWGPVFTEFRSGTGSPSAMQSMTPELDAENAAAAEARVREVIGDACEVGPAEPLSER